MTPLILVILAAMWAAVLLPPYLRDRGEGRAAGSHSDARGRLDALTSSFNGGRSYLPVQGSGQSASEVPLPHGARQSVARHGLPNSSAVQILDRNGAPQAQPTATVTPLRPLGAPEAVAEFDEAPAETTSTPARSASAVARQRRKDVLHLLLGVAGLSLVATVALGGPVLYLHLLADVALFGYVYLLIQHRKASAEREIKVAFLPHGGTGASATALLESGGGWHPGESNGSIANVRVLQAEAN